MRRHLVHLAALLALAVGSRLAAQLALGFYVGDDPWEYEALARSLVAGDGYRIDHLGTTYEAFATPLYAFLLAGTYLTIGDPILGAAVLQLALGGALVVTAYAIGLRFAGGLTAGIAAAAVSVHPGLLVYSTRVHALNLDALLVALLVLLVLKMRDAASWRSFLVYGSIVGVTALERPTFLPFAFAGMGSLALGSSSRATVMRGLVVVGLLMSIAILPWLARNAAVVGRPVLTTTMGEVLWRGNNPVASGSSLTVDGQPILSAAPEVLRLVWGRPETVQDDLFRQLAIDYVVEDPLRAARGTALKLWGFWWFGPTTGALYPKGWTAVYLVYYVGVLALAVLGSVLLLRGRRRWEVGVVALAFVTVSLTQSLFYVEGRHRWEIEGLLLVLASVPLANSIALVTARFGRGFRAGRVTSAY